MGDDRRFDITLENHAAWAGTVQVVQHDGVRARQRSCDGRHHQAAARCSCRRQDCRVGTGWRAGGRGCRAWHCQRLDRRCHSAGTGACSLRGFRRGMQIADQRAHRQQGVHGHKPLQETVLPGLDIGHDLVGLDADDGLALGNMLAVFVVPLHQRGLFHRQAQLRNLDRGRHASISRTLAAMRSASGCRNFSKWRPKGCGVNGGVSRRTGTSRW